MIQRTADKALGTLCTDHTRLADFVVRVSPHFQKPQHLQPIADKLEQARRAARGESDPVFVCSSVPPQHGKSELFLHGTAWWVSEQPSDFLGYLSYNSDIAETKSRFARDYAKIAGVALREDTHSVRTWRTVEGGGLMARSLTGGAVTGQSALKALFIDDPYQNRAVAESRAMRERVWSEFRSSVWSRLHTGTSVFVNHTRWHTDDLIGRIQKDKELSKIFEFINLPAIGDDGSALWPEVMPLELLERKRAGSSEYDWWSLYMGEPRPRDTQLFQGVAFFTELPTSYRISIGVDLAYSSKTSSDWSVAVVMAENSGRYYVLEVIRRQCAATEFAGELKALASRYPSAPMAAHVGGTELGVVDFLRREGVPLVGKPAVSDKFVRAQPFSTAWNAGQVFLREGASWVEPYTSCLLDFTGLNDPHDDDVDASSSAFDGLQYATGQQVYLPTEETLRHRPTRLNRTGLRTRGRGVGAW